MEYIVNKSVTFDRKYVIGEVIGSGIVADSRASALVESGILFPVRGGMGGDNSEVETLTLALEKEKEKLSKEKATTKKLKVEVSTLQEEITSLKATLEQLESEKQEEEITPDSEEVEEILDDTSGEIPEDSSGNTENLPPEVDADVEPEE